MALKMRLSSPIDRVFDFIDRAFTARYPAWGGLTAFSTLAFLWMGVYVLPPDGGGAVIDLLWIVMLVAIPLAAYGASSAFVEIGVGWVRQTGMSVCGAYLSLVAHVAWVFNAGWTPSLTDPASRQLILDSGAFVWYSLALAFASIVVVAGGGGALDRAVTAFQRATGRQEAVP